MKVGAFITSTAAVTTGGATDPKDYTEAINNTKQDGDNVARIGGGIDAYTVLMIHAGEADGTAGVSIIDSSATPHTITAVDDAQVDTDQAKFGSGSVLFDGTDDQLTIPDHADWYFGTGAFTIDLWVKFNSVATHQNFVWQDDAGNAYWYFGWVSTGYLDFHAIDAASGTLHSFTTNAASFVPVVGTWYHIALIRGWGGNANGWAITVDGTVVAGGTQTDASEVPDCDQVLDIGGNVGTSLLDFNGWMDEIRISKGIARWTSAFTPPTRPYSADSKTWLVGSPRPLGGTTKGLKYYISKANTIAGTMTGSFWNGNSWEAHTLVDNTDDGPSLTQNGTVTFASTVTKAKPKYLEGYFLYWYQFIIDAGDAEIYHVTLDAPFQGILDMWDGVFRDVARFYKFTTVYLDNTLNVLRDDYDSTSAITYSDLSSMAAFSDPNNALEIGFFEKMTGLKIDVAPEYTNSTATTTMSVDYWNGEDYVSAGAITDGTSESAISLAKAGVVTWNNNSLSDETLKVVSNSPPLYYYRIKFVARAMDASVRVNYVGGISAQNSISHYKFPVFAQGRVLLCADMAEEKNKALVSSKYMPQVYNGTDSVNLYFGEEGELTCGTELFSQFGSSLYALILMFKDTEFWIMAGQDIDQWENNTFLLSNTIGCPAPLTLKTINLHAEPGRGINRSLAIWQGANGIYMSDGRAPIPVHGDIKEYFDPMDSRCIKASMVGDSVGFIDPVRQEYHWLFASGTAATDLNKELIYDIARNKWFEIDRTYGQYASTLQVGVTVHDTDGNAYTYGFIDDGYMHRLEYGTTFGGASIEPVVQFGDIAFAGLSTETRLEAAKLIMVSKTVTDQNVTLTHYADTSTTGTDQTMTPIKAGYRATMPIANYRFVGDPFHSFKLVTVTDDESVGMEPLALVVTYHATDED